MSRILANTPGVPQAPRLSKVDAPTPKDATT